MTTHEPQTAIELLRDHLATHDRPVAFLFGAGSSSAVRVPSKVTTQNDGATRAPLPLIPDTSGLTALCATATAAIGKAQADAWAEMVTECKALEQDPNVENILSRIRAKRDALGASDELLGLDRKAWEVTERTVRKTIAKAASPDEDDIPGRLPHHDLARWVKCISRIHAVEIFTTNYDMLFERAFDETRLASFDGFIGSHRSFFSAEAVENDDVLPGPSWVRLWKIHGSVNWGLVEDETGLNRISRGETSEEGEMILPSHRKYDESRKQPYRALLDRLARVLARPDALMVTCGFSYSDQHINSIIFAALEHHPKSHVIALVHGALDKESRLVQAARDRSNLIVLAGDHAIIGGRLGTWRLASPMSDARPRALADLFEPAGTAQNGDELAGTLHVGDFVRLAAFLADMGPDESRRS